MCLFFLFIGSIETIRVVVQRREFVERRLEAKRQRRQHTVESCVRARYAAHGRDGHQEDGRAGSRVRSAQQSRLYGSLVGCKKRQV